MADIQSALGKSLPIIVIRNQLKAVLKDEPFFNKLSKAYASKLLDSFTITSVDKGKTIIDAYKRQRNLVMFVVEGHTEVSFPKYINSKSHKNLLASMKEIKREKETFNMRQLFGVEALKKAASCCDKNDDYYDFNIQFTEKGKIARTSLYDIREYLGCSLA